MKSLIIICIAQHYVYIKIFLSRTMFEIDGHTKIIIVIIPNVRNPICCIFCSFYTYRYKSYLLILRRATKLLALCRLFFSWSYNTRLSFIIFSPSWDSYWLLPTHANANTYTRSYMYADANLPAIKLRLFLKTLISYLLF